MLFHYFTYRIHLKERGCRLVALTSYLDEDKFLINFNCVSWRS